MAKLIRKRKTSLKTALGVTKAKRKLAKVTGIPTTKAGRKRKALNLMTGGAYGQYTKARAKVNRPFKTAKKIMSGKPVYKAGCLVSVINMALLITAVTLIGLLL